MNGESPDHSKTCSLRNRLLSPQSPPSELRAPTLYRQLKQQRRLRLQKRDLKSEFAPIQTLSRLFHLVYFVKCRQMFLELNSKGLYQSSGKEKKVVVLCSRPRQNVNSGIFTVVGQRRQRNVQKKRA